VYDAAYAKEYYKKHKAATIARTLAFKKSHPGYAAADQKARRIRRRAAGQCVACGAASQGRPRCPKHMAQYNHSMRAFMRGVTHKEYDWFLMDQKNRCRLCGVRFDFDSGTHKPNVDHDHGCSTPERHHGPHGCSNCIRGLICFFCNTVAVRFLDAYPDRQTEKERMYMKDRPLARYRESLKL